MIRFGLCIFFFATAIGVHAQAGVSYRTVAKSTDKILVDLSKHSTETLKAAPAVAKLALVVNIRERPLQEVLNNIAKATLGKWEKKTGERWLVPDPVARRERERVFMAGQDKALRTALAAAEKKGAFDPIPETLKEYEARTSRGQMNWTPGDRLAARLIKDLPVGSIASPRSVSELIFSTDPNFFRKPFPKSIVHHLATYLKESEAFARLFPHEFPTRYTRVDLKIVDPTTSSAIATLSLKSDQGDWTTGMLFLQDQRLPPVPPGIPSTFTGEMKLQRSKRTASLPSGESPYISAPDPDVLKTLQQPEEYDPLSTFSSDFWLQVSDVTKLSIVVCPSDRLLGNDEFWLQQVGSLRKASRFLWEPTAKSDGVWLTASLTSDSPGFRQIDRATLGKFLRQRARLGYDTIDSWADFVAAVGTTTDWHQLRSYVDQAVPGKPDTVNVDWKLLRLLGNMSATQRAEYLAGSPVALRQLSSNAIEAAGDWMADMSNPEVQDADLSNAAIRLEGKQMPSLWTSKPIKDMICGPIYVDLATFASELPTSASDNPVALEMWPDHTPLQLMFQQDLTFGLQLGDSFTALAHGDLRPAPARDKWFTIKTMPKELATLISEIRAKARQDDGG